MWHRSKAIRRILFGPAAIGAVAALWTGGVAQAQDVTFAGKTVRIVINLGVASGLSAHHQVFAPFVARHLPGRPKIIVESKPGGRGALGAAYLAKSVKKDGETIGTFAILSGVIATGTKLPVDMTKFVYIGSTGQGTIVYGRTDAGLKKAEDLAGPPKEILIGTANPNAALVLSIRLFLDAMGQKGKYRVVSGYRGMLGQYQAARSGEINLSILHAGQFMARWPQMKAEGKIVGLAELGVLTRQGKTIPTSGLGVPTVRNLWARLKPASIASEHFKAFRTIQLSKSMSWLHVLPPGTDQKYRAVWNKAFEAAFADPEYLALLKKQGSPPARYTDGETTTRMIQELVRDSRKPSFKKVIATVTTRK